MRKTKILVIAIPASTGVSGGAKRSYNVLRNFNTKNTEITLLIPYYSLIWLVMRDKELKKDITLQDFSELERQGIIIPKTTYLYLNRIHDSDTLPFKDHNISSEMPLIFNKIAKYIHNLFIFGTYHLSKLERIYLEKIILESSEFDVIYSMHEINLCIRYMKYVFKDQKPLAFILFQLHPFLKNDLILRDHRKITSVPFQLLETLFLKSSLIKAIVKNNINIISISELPLLNSGLSEWSQKNNVNITIMKPSVAIDSKYFANDAVTKYDGKIIFFASPLGRRKGLFDLIDILASVKSKFELDIFGTLENDEVRTFLKELMKKFNVNAHGFVEDDFLIKSLMKSKVCIFPSRYEGFGLAVLESLAAHTPVVMYDSTAQDIYYGIDAIKIVKFGDFEAFGRAIDHFLELNESEMNNIFMGDKIVELMRAHSDWKKVANEEMNVLGLSNVE